MKMKTTQLGDLSNEINNIDFHCEDLLIQADEDTLYFWVGGDTSKPHTFSVPSALLSRILKVQEEQLGSELAEEA
jgi:hypothetical protein